MTAFQNPTNRPKTQAPQDTFQGLDVSSQGFCHDVERYVYTTTFTTVALPAFYFAIFYTFFRTAFRAKNHGASFFCYI